MRTVGPELLADRVPEFAVDDSLMLARVHGALMRYRPRIEHVRQQKPECRPAKRSGRMALPVFRRPLLGGEATFPDGRHRSLQRTRFLAQAEHLPNLSGF